jgi:hypothetical protein
MPEPDLDDRIRHLMRAAADRAPDPPAFPARSVAFRGRRGGWHPAAVVAAVAAAVIVAVVALTVSSPSRRGQRVTVSPPPPTSGTPATVAAAPSVSVSPQSGLHDGQQIRVEVNGFPTGARVRVAECLADDLRVAPAGGSCGPQPALQPFIDTDSAGSGTLAFTVRDSAVPNPTSPQPVPCIQGGGCVLVASDGTHRATATLSLAVPAPTTAPTATAPLVSLAHVDWSSVAFPMTQCGTYGGHPNPGVTAQPVVLGDVQGAQVAVVVVRCLNASNPPNAVFVYDGATGPTTPHLAQTLVTEHDFWVAEGPPVIQGSTLTLRVSGYQPSDPRYLPSVHTNLTWTWSGGAYHETSPEPPHQYSGP